VLKTYFSAFSVPTDKVKALPTVPKSVGSSGASTPKESSAAGGKESQPCFEHTKRVKNIPAESRPRCTPAGQYDVMQCTASQALCWCSDQNGNEIAGTRRPRSAVDCCEYSLPRNIFPILISLHSGGIFKYLNAFKFYNRIPQVRREALESFDSLFVPYLCLRFLVVILSDSEDYQSCDVCVYF